MLHWQSLSAGMRFGCRMPPAFSILLFAISCFFGWGTRCKPCANEARSPARGEAYWRWPSRITLPGWISRRRWLLWAAGRPNPLRRQGADPGLGSRLPELFRQAGIRPVETGSLHRDEEHLPGRAERELEWAVMEADLAGLFPAEENSSGLSSWNEAAWQRGERVLHVPTYWIMGGYDG